MKVVVDTHVFATSIFGGRPQDVLELWFSGRILLCLSEPIVTEYQQVLREVGAVREAEEHTLLETFASGEGVVYVNAPPDIGDVSPSPGDDKFLACALELGAERIVAGTPDLLALGSYMGTPILTPQAFLEQASPAR